MHGREEAQGLLGLLASEEGSQAVQYDGLLTGKAAAEGAHLNVPGWRICKSERGANGRHSERKRSWQGLEDEHVKG